jgi:hypothetical protein
MWACLLSLLASGQTTAGSREQVFWEWFTKHEPELFAIKMANEPIADLLHSELARINPDLTFEFGTPQKDGTREFVISANGIKSAFPAVESLWKSSPSLPRWKFTKFRPRMKEPADIEMNGRKIKAGDVRCVLFKSDDPSKLGTLLLLPGYSKEDPLFKNFGYLFLDETLGEYDVEMRVGAVVFDSTNSKYADRSFPFSELATRFDEYFAAKR